jgi:hypothetical protein
MLQDNIVMIKKFGFAGVCFVGFLLLANVSCGGSSGAVNSNLQGSYDGTVVNPGKTSQTVELAVSANGSISGRCTLLSLTSGAIMARAVLEGTVNQTTREFQLAGIFQAFIPPPPDGSGTGPVTVSGSLPTKNDAHGPMQVQDSLGILNGIISSTPTE